MSPARLTIRRTLTELRSSYSTVTAAAGFLVASAALFTYGLCRAEGVAEPLTAIWAMSVAPLLPLVSAVFGMDVWSEERRSGRIELMLSAPVDEAAFVIGKFLGVWIAVMLLTAISAAVSFSALFYLSPVTLGNQPLHDFPPVFLLMAVQSLLWCAIAVASSACFNKGTVAALISIALGFALPRGIWAALAEWSEAGRAAFGVFPPDAQVTDAASGLLQVASTIEYLILTAAVLFVNFPTFIIIHI